MSEAVLERLKSGIRRFHLEVHAENAEDYLRLGSTQQQPHTLIIACADSRVDVEVLTSSGPGEISRISVLPRQRCRVFGADERGGHRPLVLAGSAHPD